MKRIARIASVVVLSSSTLAGCASMESFDTNAAVDARPECAAQPDRPDQPLPSWCQRETGVRFSSERRSEPLDLSGKDGAKEKDDPM